MDNADGTGYLSALLEAEQQILTETAEFLTTEHTPAEFAKLQNALAQRALKTLAGIR